MSDLDWPDGWPRTPSGDRLNGRDRFKRPDGPWTFAAAREALLEELWRHTKSAVISSNFPRDKKNLPSGQSKRPDDQAIAIYFERKGKSYVIACDRYRDAEGNMRSIALALEAMRQLERHGGGVMMEKAFAGFIALPSPPKPHEILGVAAGASATEIRTAWRRLIAEHHPDQGGSESRAAELNAARDAMLKGPKS